MVMNKTYNNKENSHIVKGWFEERFQLREIVEKNLTKKKNTEGD